MHPQKQTSKRSMPVFRCSCGTEILIIPDLAEMDRALSRHEAEHKRLTGRKVSQQWLAQEIIKTLSRQL